jgi:tetratricopeptide (TPR) repeat protein
VGSPETARWPELVQTLYVRELTGVEKLGVLDPLTLNELLEPAVGQRRRSDAVYRALAAARPTFIIDGSITPVRGGYRIQSNLMNPQRAEVELSLDAVIAGEDELDDAIAKLSQQMLTYLQINVLRTAQTELRPWLPYRPRNLEAIKAFLQGNEFSLRNEPGAGKYMKRAIALEPSFIAPRLWLISGYVMARDFDSAREHYRYLESIESTASPFEQAMIGWAGAYIAGDAAVQQRHLEVALRYSPDNDLLLIMLGEARFRLDDFEGALAALEPLLRMKWRYPTLYTLQGASLLALGRVEEARQALTAALANAPVDGDVYGMLAAVALARGDVGEAERYRRLQGARSREVGTPAGAATESFAVHLLRVGLHERAAENLRDALASGAWNPGYYDWFAEAYYSSDQAKKSMQVYYGALLSRPGWSDAHLILGRIHEARREDGAARAEYVAFLAAEPSGPAAAGVRRRLDLLRTSTGAATAARR